MKDLNKKLEKISCHMHKRTGYSLTHAVLECDDNMACHRLFKFNSDEWAFFLDLLEEACK